MTLDEIVSRLKRAKQTNNGYTALCPAHKDEKNSLSVSEATGKILLKCFAECGVEEICTALEIKVSDLFTSNADKPKKKEIRRELECAYDYADVNGEVLYQNVKERVTYDDGSTGKVFFARRFDKGKEIRGLGGVKRVPYRLPELVKLPVNFAFITAEGEKDADKLKENGLIATSHKNWKPESNYLLKGKDVVIFADHDKPGIKLANETARIMSPDAKAVKIVDCFEGEPIPDKHGRDVSDWLELGHTSAELTDIIKNTALWQQAEETDATEQRAKRPTVAEQLVRLAENLTFFHTANREPFAVVAVNSHFENLKLTSKDFRLHISRLFWEETKQAVNSQSLQDALNVLQGKALFESKCEETNIRFAEKDGAIFIDLGNLKWEAVKVTGDGWRIVESKDVPVRFRRTRGLLPLPTPKTENKGLSELKEFINIADDDFVLLCAWAVSAMRPNYPFPILAIHGGQGSGKSTNTKILRDLIDPNASALRSKPRDERDLMIAARNGYILSFDNLSNIAHEFSDSLCRLSTGGGLATRELHTDDDEIIFDAKRPLILNGITELATRPDLLERCVMLNLPTIDAERRQAEQTFKARFDEAKPRLFGALLDKLSESMRELPNVKLDQLPRMADFAKFAYAGFGKEFLDRYTDNRDDANEIALENSPIGETLLKFLNGLFEAEWKGTANNLLDALEKVADERTKNSKEFPKKANKLSAYIKRIEANLTALGWKVERSKEGKSRTKQIIFTHLENYCNLSSASSASSAKSVNGIEYNDLTADDKADDRLQADDRNNSSNFNRPPVNTANTAFNGKADDRTIADDRLQTYSNLPNCKICKLPLELTKDKKEFYCSVGCGGFAVATAPENVRRIVSSL